jgi:hypothetical protein
VRHFSMTLVTSWLVAIVAGAQPAVDKLSGLPLPEELGKLRRTEIIDDEAQHPGLGTAVYYNTPGLRATVYIYNAGQRTIPDGIGSQIVKANYEAAMTEVRKASSIGVYTLTSDVSAGSSYLVPASKTIPVFSAEFSYRQDGAEFFSWLYVTGAKNNLIKLRISSLIDDKDRVESTRREFLKGVAGLLSVPASTGAADAPRPAPNANTVDTAAPGSFPHSDALAARYIICAGSLMAYATFHDDVNLAKSYMNKGSAYMFLAAHLSSLQAASQKTIEKMHASVKVFQSAKSNGGPAALKAKFEEEQKRCTFKGVPNQQLLENDFGRIQVTISEDEKRGR